MPSLAKCAVKTPARSAYLINTAQVTPSHGQRDRSQVDASAGTPRGRHPPLPHVRRMGHIRFLRGTDDTRDRGRGRCHVCEATLVAEEWLPSSHPARQVQEVPVMPPAEGLRVAKPYRHGDQPIVEDVVHDIHAHP